MVAFVAVLSSVEDTYLFALFFLAAHSLLFRLLALREQGHSESFVPGVQDMSERAKIMRKSSDVQGFQPLTLIRPRTIWLQFSLYNNSSAFILPLIGTVDHGWIKLNSI